MSAPPDTHHVTATYDGPAPEEQTFALALPAVPAEGDVAAKTAYLSAMRAQLGQLQEQINSFLTVKMEVEKAQQGQGRDVAASGKGTTTRDEEREEDLYGEEQPEDE